MRLASSVLVLSLALLGACTKSSTADPPDGGEADSGISFVPPDPVDAGPPEVDAGPPSSDVGSPCTSDADCDAVCVTEDDGFRDGYCTNFCDDVNPCPTGSACVRVSRSQSLCLAECEAGASERSCRAGYGCAVDVSLPAPVCIPGCTDDTDCPTGALCNPEGGGSCYDPDAAWGDACERSSECPDGAFCYAESFRGWPGGMCVAFGCDPAASGGGGCPTGTACLDSSGRGFGRCVTSCATVDDCRAGYECLATPDDPMRLVCQPACADASHCTSGRSCTAEGTCG